MPVAFDLRHRSCKVEQLQRLPEALSRSARDLSAVVRHSQQLSLPHSVTFFFRLLTSQFLISAYIFLRRIMTDEDSLIEFSLYCKIRVFFCQLCKAFLGSFYHAVKAFFHKPLIIHDKMADTAIVIQIRLEDLLACLRTLYHFLIHVFIGEILNGFSFPVMTELYEFFPVFFICKIMLVMCAFFKRLVKCFMKHPVDRELRILR